MCGIAGLVAPKESSDWQRSTLTKMADAIRHRGPDDEGFWVGGRGVGLAHRRLAILDLSPLGHQPMASPSGRYQIVFNGEIYNFRELRKILADEKQIVFKSQSDTEVLAAALEVWGVEKTLSHLNGMFAIAAWDAEEKRLILARDRMGEKPLYWGVVNGRFIFASELSAILAIPDSRPELSPLALQSLLRHSGISAPQSIFKNISKLKPAHWLEVRVSANEFSVGEAQCYWQIPDFNSATDRHQQDSELRLHLQTVGDLIEDSVRLRMVSDVPVGTFLSGGIDSSLITALMQKNSRLPVRSFTVGFEDPKFNEAPFARKIAQHLGTDHTELTVTEADLLRVVPRLAQLYSEPFADSSQIPTFLVSELTRKHVTVVLSGDGGDEVFAGYDRYRAVMAAWLRMSKVPHLAKVMSGWTLAQAPPKLLELALRGFVSRIGMSTEGRSLGEKFNKLGHLLLSDDFAAFYSGMSAQWLKPSEVLDQDPVRDEWLWGAGGYSTEPQLRQMIRMDMGNYLADDILVKVDRASMAVSLESRIPLLDHRLIEQSFRLPQGLMIKGHDQKWIMKELLSRHVPRELFERPKMGFGVPLANWLRGPLRTWASDLLSEERLRKSGYFKATQVQKVWQMHLSGEVDRAHELWPILMFEDWRQAWSY